MSTDKTRILKFRLDPETVALPGPVIAVAWQHGEIMAWCEVAQPSEPAAYRRIVIVPTGGYVPPDAVHVGSAVSDALVFHVYEKKS